MGEIHPRVGEGKAYQQWQGQVVFLECGVGTHSGICSMVVWGDELDVNRFEPDVFFYYGRTFVVHYVQC